MPRWEYCQIHAEYLFDKGNASSVKHLRYYKMKQSSSIDNLSFIDNIEETIAKLGNEGWELVAVIEAASGNGSVANYYFKRPSDIWR